METKEINQNTITEKRAKKMEKDLKQASRKSFVANEINGKKEKQEELAVFTEAKKLVEYIFVVTEKSPLKQRWSIIDRLKNKAIEVVENLYSANFERDEKRLAYQKQASVCLSVLGMQTEIAQTMKVLTTKQSFEIAKRILLIRKLLGGWARVKTSKKPVTAK